MIDRVFKGRCPGCHRKVLVSLEMDLDPPVIRHSKISSEFIENVKKLAEIKTVKEVANELGVSYAMIANLRSRLGIKFKGIKKDYSKVDELLSSSMLNKEIADVCGVSISAVSNRRQVTGIRHVGYKRRRIVELLEEGKLNQSRIAKEFGVSRQRVSEVKKSMLKNKRKV
jgi:predicted transcriptional regulator